MKEVDLELIKEKRKAMKFSLQDMAFELGFTSASTYYRYEEGIYKFAADHIPIISKKLKLSVRKIFCKKVC